MKKILKLSAIIMAALFMSGCTGNLKSENISMETSIDSDVNIDDNGRQYKAHLVYTPEGHISLSLTEPESVSGLTFVWNGGKYEISKGDLKGEFTLKPFGEDSFAFIVAEVLGNLSDTKNLRLVEKNEGDKVYEGKINDVIFNIKTDKSGRIMLLEIPEKNITLSFV